MLAKQKAAPARPPVVEDNVELVRRAYRVLEDLRNDPDGPADRLVRELMHKQFELHLPPVYPDSHVFRGPDGLKRWTLKFKEIWGEWRFEVQRYLDAGDRVVALIHVVAEGGKSGVHLERDTAHVWTLADGQVTRCEVYLDRSEALKALGLKE
jgi:ketosteroid isomerase-like protein